jgi:hypothetical protein
MFSSSFHFSPHNNTPFLLKHPAENGGSKYQLGSFFSRFVIRSIIISKLFLFRSTNTNIKHIIRLFKIKVTVTQQQTTFAIAHSYTHSLTHTLPHTLTHTATHSLIHTLTHSLTHSYTPLYTLSHTLTHSRTLSQSYSHSLFCGEKSVLAPALCARC